MELIGAGLVLVSSGIVLWSIISWDLEQAKKARESEDTVDDRIQDLQDKSREHRGPNESWSDSYRRDV